MEPIVYSRCIRISCPRCRASQSNSFSSRERTCVMVAIYFRSLVLVIASGFCSLGLHFVAQYLRQSHPLRCSREYRFTRAKAYGFSSWIPTVDRKEFRRLIPFVISGVNIMATVRPCLPLVSTIWSLQWWKIYNNKTFSMPIIVICCSICRI